MSTYFTNQTYINNFIEKGEAELVLFFLTFVMVGTISKCTYSLYSIINRWCKKRKLENIRQDLMSTSSAICSICLEDYSNNNNKITRTLCGHIFHKKCIFNWIKEHNSCPECRAEILQ